MVLVALPLLMFVASVGTFMATGTVQGSISAYYAGPLRDVFVGMLVGLAVCLVAYKGAPVEDYALDLAGFYALFVAFVPFQGYLEGLPPGAFDAAIVGVRIVTISVLLVVAVVSLRGAALGALGGAQGDREGPAGSALLPDLAGHGDRVRGAAGLPDLRRDADDVRLDPPRVGVLPRHQPDRRGGHPRVADRGRRGAAAGTAPRLVPAPRRCS